MKTYKIAAIPGDGIGGEVVEAGVEVLRAVADREGGFALSFDAFEWGGDYYKRHGRMMPEDGREQIRNHDAILFGSAGHPEIPDHVTLWGLRLAICQPFDQYANVRPTRILPGITSPAPPCIRYRTRLGDRPGKFGRANTPGSAGGRIRARR